MDAARLVRAMMEAGETPENKRTDFIGGEVTSTDPLIVKCDKLELDSDFLIASPFAWDETIPEDIRIGNGLEVGDNVLMIRSGKGQKFYILHKVN